MTINTNTVNNINSIQSGLLEKVATGIEVNKASDNAAALSIAENIDLQRSTLSQSIDNANSGIAMSNIAQDAISSQKDILSNMRTETLKAMDSTTSIEDKEIIANQINKYIEQYEQIANTTNYNGEQLLKTKGDSSDDISIAGDGSFISMQKADTTSVTDTLKSLMSDFAGDTNSLSEILEALDSGVDTLASAASEFGSASNILESMVRKDMNAQTNLGEAKSKMMDFDYTKGIAEFNKTNIQSQLGYLVQSQAHAVQSRAVTLLS